VVGTIGILLPSFIVIVGLSAYLDRLRASAAFNGIVRGVLCSFVGLLLAVAVRFALGVDWDWPHLALAGGAFIALMLRVDLLWVVAVGAAASVVMLR
jgi:chromate transporter